MLGEEMFVKSIIGYAVPFGLLIHRVNQLRCLQET